jgi:hypothetical protein
MIATSSVPNEELAARRRGSIWSSIPSSASTGDLLPASDKRAQAVLPPAFLTADGVLQRSSSKRPADQDGLRMHPTDLAPGSAPSMPPIPAFSAGVVRHDGPSSGNKVNNSIANMLAANDWLAEQREASSVASTSSTSSSRVRRVGSTIRSKVSDIFHRKRKARAQAASKLVASISSPQLIMQHSSSHSIAEGFDLIKSQQALTARQREKMPEQYRLPRRGVVGVSTIPGMAEVESRAGPSSASSSHGAYRPYQPQQSSMLGTYVDIVEEEKNENGGTRF